MVLKITNAFAFWSCRKNAEPVNLLFQNTIAYPEYIGLKGYIERKNKTEYESSNIVLQSKQVKLLIEMCRAFRPHSRHCSVSTILKFNVDLKDTYHYFTLIHS